MFFVVVVVVAVIRQMKVRGYTIQWVRIYMHLRAGKKKNHTWALGSCLPATPSNFFLLPLLPLPQNIVTAERIQLCAGDVCRLDSQKSRACEHKKHSPGFQLLAAPGFPSFLPR